MAGVSDFVRRPTALTVSCANCGAPVGLRTPGLTKTLVCDSCGSVLDLSNTGVATVVGQQKAFAQFRTTLPLGARGTLAGQEWEVVGYVQRTAVGWQVVWSEYLLFNPLQGYRWLVENVGHWTLMRPETDPPKVLGTQATLVETGEQFQKFDEGKAKVMRVIGEFYWRVKVGDVVNTADYIAPPYQLSIERDGSEIVASRGEYLEPGVVGAAFGVKTDQLPKRIGIGMNQPLGWMEDAKWLGAVAALMTLVLVVAQLTISPGAPRDLVRLERSVAPRSVSEVINHNSLVSTARSKRSEAESSYRLPPHLLTPKVLARAKQLEAWADSVEALPKPDPQQATLDPVELGSFTLNRDTRNAYIDLQTGVSNSWASFDLTLFNESTGESFYWSKDIEYYHGGSGEDSWTEGSRGADALTFDLTPGDYVATLEGVCDRANNQGVDVRLTIRSNERVWWAFVLALIGIWSVTGLVIAVGYNQEVQRWSNSDYSPYASSDSDDDDDE